jgi:hypothetical protein
VTGPQRIQLRRTKGGASKATTYVVLSCRGCDRPGAKGQQGYCSPECRFWSKVLKTSTCWIWTGARNTPKGYGRFDANRQRYMAHRYAYELLVGHIPDGMQLDHLCLNKMCVNPSCVEVVTEAEHGRRSGVMSGIARARCA